MWFLDKDIIIIIAEAEVEAEVAKLCLTLCDPMDCSP